MRTHSSVNSCTSVWWTWSCSLRSCRWRSLRWEEYHSKKWKCKHKKEVIGLFARKRSNLGWNGKTTEEKMRQTTINKAMKDSTVKQEVCRMIYRVLSFNLVKSPFFQKTLKVIENFGRAYVSPSYYKAESHAHKRWLTRLTRWIWRNTGGDYWIWWKRTYCTLMSNYLTNSKSKLVTNFS